VVEQLRRFHTRRPLRHIYGIGLRHDASPVRDGSSDATISLPRQAQLDPTAASVLAMLLPAACTFCPWELACW
jgi:hypothetical protein